MPIGMICWHMFEPFIPYQAGFMLYMGKSGSHSHWPQLFEQNTPVLKLWFPNGERRTIVINRKGQGRKSELRGHLHLTLFVTHFSFDFHEFTFA